MPKMASSRGFFSLTSKMASVPKANGPYRLNISRALSEGAVDDLLSAMTNLNRSLREGCVVNSCRGAAATPVAANRAMPASRQAEK
jgi:hypothetical protein